MITKKILAAAVAFLVVPALGQTNSDSDKNGYQGGPKTEVPHHMGKKETVGVATKSQSGGHHYTGGPGSMVRHHMGEKQ